MMDQPRPTGLNPKLDQAAGKPQLDLLEPVADQAIAAALADGADKYGRRNYTQVPISLRGYLAAMKRHIDAVLDGEDDADDSGIDHLGHVGANVHIILKARAAGTLVDDR